MSQLAQSKLLTASDQLRADVRKAIASVVLLFVAITAGAATVTFVSPLDGMQTLGPMALEVTTTATKIDRVEFYVDGSLAGVARTPPYRIAHDFGTSPMPHEVTAKVWSNAFRTVDSARVLTAAVTAGETTNVDFVEVPLRIRAPRAVHASELRVTENGIEQTIRELRADRGAARFVFIIDRSLSMGDGRLAAALRAVDEESKLLRADDRVEVVLFNHNVAKPRAVARGERLARIFGEVLPNGGTSLRDALASAASRERTYAIVISDGGDRNSESSEEESLRRISGTKTVVSSIILGDSSPFLDRVAKTTGGSVVRASRSTLDEQLRRLIVDINSRYTLAYQSHGNGEGWRKVSVIANGRNVEIINPRKEYFAQ
ncbi:MAG: Ca-activated chloride channel [Acidobacteriota bacterium]|jgi:Mg-chelatase subunit ChlD|nr:Ca-activated chloride channel [Acidobacteriota bacterium]